MDTTQISGFSFYFTPVSKKWSKEFIASGEVTSPLGITYNDGCEEKFTLSNIATLTEAHPTILMPPTMAMEGLMDRPISTKPLILNAIIQGSSHPVPMIFALDNI